MSTPPSDAPAPASAPADADRPRPHRYDAALADTIESRWQAAWAAAGAFRTPNPGDPGFDPAKPKFYCLDMFPYPSGAGLHVGHPEGYTATDILCRYKRHTGHNVLHPMGWDAFGLPAEQYAIQTGIHPAETTRTAIDTFRRQLQRFGFSYDWDREFATIDPDYYRWTQWIWVRCYESWYDPRVDAARPIVELAAGLEAGALAIGMDGSAVEAADADAGRSQWPDMDAAARRLVLDEHRLAYLGEQTVNWCPKLGTALANEEVIDGRSERGSHPVHRMPLRQWMFRITAYADRLLAGLDDLSSPESTRTQQREWIGRSEGGELDFPLAAAAGGHAALRVYTTRPDTIFGATYMVVPEHPLVAAVLADPPPETDAAAIAAYADAARDRADVDRMADADTKTGVDLGIRAVNPATGVEIPVWTADYVLMGYGTGAIMAVPAHDARDFAFARTFGLDIVDAVDTPERAALRDGCRRLESAKVDPAARLAVLAAYVAARTGEASRPDAAWGTAVASAGTAGTDGTEGTGGGELAAAHEGVFALAHAAGGGPEAGPDVDALMDAARSGRLVDLGGEASSEPGLAVHSRSADGRLDLDGLATAEAIASTIDWIEAEGIGRRRVNYRLRDWLFSRQRYWGEPFPIVYDESGNHHAVAPSHLPVKLPPLADYAPVESDVPAPLLAKATDWVRTTAGEAGVPADVLPPDTPVRRETNTMPGWAGSCWYHLRYCSPGDDDRFVDREAERYWMQSRRGSAPEAEGAADADADAAATNSDTAEAWTEGVHHAGGVDLYVGGAEHAVLHLLYARFWHKVLFDLGEVSTPEPYGRLFHQGLITAYSYQRPDRTLVPTDEVDIVTAEDGTETYTERATGVALERVVAKMSKSLRNVVNPDDVIAAYGADTFRLYEMYMGPLDASKPWNTQDIAGPYRFLQRTWRVAVDEDTGALRLTEKGDDALETLLHRTIAKVAEDVERLSFNTAIAAMIEFVNQATKHGPLSRDQLERFMICLSPFAPHLAEEIWSRAGGDGLVCSAAWPTVDADRLTDDTIELPVQINGKVRGRVEVAADADQATVEAAALALPAILSALDGKTIRKVIVVPGRIVNVIVG